MVLHFMVGEGFSLWWRGHHGIWTDTSVLRQPEDCVRDRAAATARFATATTKSKQAIVVADHIVGTHLGFVLAAHRRVPVVFDGVVGPTQRKNKQIKIMVNPAVVEDSKEQDNKCCTFK